MLGILALLFLVVPIAELAVIVAVSGQIGLGSTLLGIVAVSVIGAWMVQQQGLSVLRRLQGQLQQGEMPTNELIDGGLILFAGALMLTPGFLTDGLGLVLLFPPTRAGVRTVLRRRFRDRITVAGPGFTTFGPGGPRRDAPRPRDVWDADSWEHPPNEPTDRPELP